MAGPLDNILGVSAPGGAPVDPWKAAALQAMYGGAKFNYQSHTRTGGHRVNVIDYPESAQHDLENMGPMNDSFQVSGYIVGGAYTVERDVLLKQLKDSAAKELVIPTEGIFRVKNTNWSMNETKDEQRIARFSMTFQIKETIEVLVLGDTKQNIFDKKASLLEKITDWFEKAYDISQKPVSVINDAISTVDKVLDVVRAAKKVTGSIADFQRAYRELKGRTIALALNARAMADDIGGLLNFGTDPSNQGSDPGNVEAIALDPARITEDSETSTGNEQRLEAKDLQSKMQSPLVPNSQEPSPLIQKMINLQALAADSGLIAVSSFDSPQQAQEEEQALVERYDALIDSITPSDELYYAIRDLQQAVHEDLQERIIRLPRVVVKQNDAERNALELNYSTYGDMDEYEPFNKRNSIIHPGFIPASVNLEYKVSSDE